MRRKSCWIAAICTLALPSLLPMFSSGASPASKEKVIYSFTGGLDGGSPLSDLTLDADGNLYGTTSQGGTGCRNGGCGTVFELKRTRDGWKEQVLYRFIGGKDGSQPAAGVIFDSSGNLYGTTANGGAHFFGTAFKLTPTPEGGWKKTTIYDFADSVGDNPAEDLVFDPKGNLLGTTSTGATGGCDDNAGCGSVFELTQQSDGAWGETTIHSFEGAPDGGIPASALVPDSAGNFYGVTQVGGTGKCRNYYDGPGCGTVYKLSSDAHGNWTETLIYNFFRGGGFGKRPSGDVFVDKVGNLLGLSRYGGNGPGTVYELRTTQKRGWRQNVLYRFYGRPDGAGPTGRLAVDPNGSIFGVTTDFYGKIFELRHFKHGWKERVLYTFSGASDGINPMAGLVVDSQGHLYGTTRNGGSGNRTDCDVGSYTGCGTVYEVTP
jgi:uncharacterized repeat protein (TIGR03803 family)